MSNTPSPAPQLSLAALLSEQTSPEIYAAVLALATKLGLPVTTWAPGDPTRSLFYLVAQILAALESTVIGFISTAALDYAAQPNPDGTPNPWLAVMAQEVFGVTVPGAIYASTTVNLTNTGGGVYDFDPGDITFTNSATGVTYSNTTSCTLTGVGTEGATASVTVAAQVIGTAGSADAGAIDTVEGYNGITCTNPAAAVGVDAQAPQTTVQQCRDMPASLSPNGPTAAYSYVALNQTLTGVQSVNRVRTYPDSETGDVLVVVAGPSGTVDDGDVSNVQAAINEWATPLGFTATVASATPVTIPVTYSIWLYDSVTDSTATIEANIQTALETFFANRPIGGDVTPPATTGYLYEDMISATIGAVYENQTVRVVVSLPTGDTLLTNTQVPILGTVTPTVTMIPAVI